MPVRRRFVLSADIHGGTALATVLAAMLVVVPQQSAADRAGSQNVPDGGEVLVGPGNSAGSSQPPSDQTLVIDGGATITFDGNGTIDPGADDGSTETIFNAGTVNGANANGGTATTVTLGDGTNPVNFTNEGTIDVSGDAALAGDARFFSNDAGATATIRGDLDSLTMNEGTVTVGDGPGGAVGLLSTDGNVLIRGGTVAVGSNALAVGGNLSMTDGTTAGALTIGTGGSVAAANVFVQAGSDFDNDGGTVQTGTLTVRDGGVLTQGAATAIPGQNTIFGNVRGESDIGTGGDLFQGTVGGDLTMVNGAALGDGTAQTLTVTGTVETDGAIDGYALTADTLILNDGASLTAVELDLDLLQTATTIATSDFDGPAGTLDFSIDVLSGGVVDVDSSVAFDEAANDDVTVRNGGAFNVVAGGGVTDGGVLTIQNGGDATLAAGTAIAFDEVDVQAGGTLTQGNYVNGTTLTVEGTVDGTVTNNGVLNLGGAITVGLAQNAAGASTTVQSDATVGTNLNLGDGSLTLDADLDVTGDVNRTGGTVTINAGNTLTASTFDNDDGTLTLGTGATLDADLENDAAATVALAGGTVEGDVLNEGTLTSTGTSRVAGPVDNDGTMSVDGGTLTVTGAIDSSDDLDVADGAVLAAQGGLTVSGGTADVAGTVRGTVTNDGGATTVTGAVDGTLANAGGTIDLSGTATTVDNAAGTADVSGDVAGVLTNAATMTFSGTAGQLRATDGTLTVDGSPSVAGTALASGDARINAFAGDVLAADLDAQDDARLNLSGATLDGDADFRDASVIGSTGTSRITGDVRSEGTVLVSSGQLTVDGGLTSADGLVSVATAGTLVATGGLAATDGTVDVDGTLTGDVTATGADVDVGGTLAGDVTLRSGGELIVEDGALLDGDVVATASTVIVQDPSGQPTAAVIPGAGTISGDLTATDSTVVIEGNVGGDVIVQGGDLTMSGDVAGDMTVSGTSTDVTGPAMVGGLLSANGGLDLDSSLTVGSATISTAFDLADGATLAGGDVQVRTDATLGAGTISADATFRGTTQTSAGLTLSGDTTNTSVFNVDPGVAITGAFDNQGTLRLDGNTATFGGGLANSGAVAVADGATDDVITVNGAFDGQGGVYQFDIDLSASGASSDRIVVAGGPATGTGVVDFTNVTPAGATFTDGRIDVVGLDESQANTLELTSLGLPTSGALAFVFTNDARAGADDDYRVIVGQNPAIGGLAGGIALTQSLIGSVINRPSSPFVAGNAAATEDDPCGVGVWARATGGTADTRGETTSAVGTFTSDVEATYQGIQIGGDYACFNGFYNGWDLAFGGILGLNSGETEQPVFDFDPNTGTQLRAAGASSITTADFEQTYAGLYVAASRGRLLADLQFRVEDTEFDIENVGVNGGVPLGLTAQSFDVQGYTLSGSVSYAFPISADLGLTFVPTAGFSYTTSETDTIDFAGPAALVLDDSTTEIGFVGATLARTQILPDQVSAVNYFATGTIYNDFGDGVDSTFFSDVNDPTTASVATSSNLGTYGELSLGLNYTRILQEGAPAGIKQVNGSIRLDGRSGSEIDSWGITAQARIQF